MTITAQEERESGVSEVVVSGVWFVCGVVVCVCG